MIALKFLLVVITGYLVGSIPFGLIISKKTARVDVREYGSGKTGTTNVLRVAGKKAAFAVACLDIFKGVFAVTIAGLILQQEYTVIDGSSLFPLVKIGQVLAALSAVAGHNWPIFVKFKGGRGVATYMGGLLALYPPAAIFGGEVLIFSAAVTRYVSLGSIIGTLAAYAILIPLTVVNDFPIEYLIYTLIGVIFIIIVHRDNIIRLASGKERKLGERA